MAPQTVLLGLIALWMFYQVASRYVERERCPYCGVISTHSPECPYNLEREERT